MGVDFDVVRAATARLRNSDRYDICLPASLTLSGIDYAVELKEISSSGFSGTCAVRLPVGQLCEAHLPQVGSVHVIVKWAGHGTFGCSFVRGLPWRVLMPMMRESASLPDEQG